ncbi:MAG: hypothetical protein IKJ11_03255 [Clostridia bacterium]|nr:hypothetical protein [Clostridia bacterium]
MTESASGRIRRRAVLILAACIYALLFSLGSQIDAVGTVDAGKAIVRFALALPVSLGVLWALFVYGMPCLERGKPGGGQARLTFCVFAFLLFCYGAMFLIHYPGSFMYDTQRQVFQIARNEYEMFHPLVHTLLIRACLSFVNVFDSFEKCAALYSVITLTIAALCFSQVCASIGRMYGKRAAVISAAFFGLYPSHMAFAANCTKDGLFAAFFALFFALCFEETNLGCLSKGRRALRLAAGTLACLLRNNMIYALVVWAALLLVCGRVYLRRALCCVLAVILCIGANGIMQRMTHAGSGSKIEMMSVPIQQLSRARLERSDCFTQEEKELMDLVFVDALYHTPEPLYEHYEPTLADPVKNYLDEALVLERMDDLARMWLSVGSKCPGVYLDAFLNLALPSLYPYSQYKVAQPYIETGLQPGVVTAPFGQPPMTQPGRFAGIRAWMYEHIYSTGADDIPLIRYLFNTGFIYWILLMIMLFELYSGRYDRFMLLLLPALLWGTYLLGPVMQGRYLYPFICVLPLFVCRQVKDK